jgi:hypothetical protein
VNEINERFLSNLLKPNQDNADMFKLNHHKILTSRQPVPILSKSFDFYGYIGHNFGPDPTEGKIKLRWIHNDIIICACSPNSIPVI